MQQGLVNADYVVEISQPVLDGICYGFYFKLCDGRIIEQEFKDREHAEAAFKFVAELVLENTG
jgi:hypothetical protein